MKTLTITEAGATNHVDYKLPAGVAVAGQFLLWSGVNEVVIGSVGLGYAN